MTAHEDAIKSAVDRLLIEDPQWPPLLYEILGSLHRGAYPKFWVDMMFQNWSGAPTVYDAYVFANIHTAIREGDMTVTRIRVGSSPVADKLADENNARLARVKHPFTATFYGGYGDQDGFLSWSERLTAPEKRFRCDGSDDPNCRDEHVVHAYDIPPGSAPLEVGYTRSSCTWFHLIRNRCVARWPYDSDDVFLIFAHDAPVEDEEPNWPPCSGPMEFPDDD